MGSISERAGIGVGGISSLKLDGFGFLRTRESMKSSSGSSEPRTGGLTCCIFVRFAGRGIRFGQGLSSGRFWMFREESGAQDLRGVGVGG